ncbi:holo-ACP synthase [Helicobacter sp. 13S00477-4]|uniref:holo-ACP synthase n=1 Tax=Helicobacter sp. 13S00477-4 TaxID=1905759 RepID=UPI000BA5F7A8|nr:holo-ACP synthase [Helicobacter sp. 13S00477-4]PAF50442.1 holo-ACP synthase [Helicobacter sp. 13S00477-4]
MIGIDIVSIERIEKNIQKYQEGFLNKFLCIDEINLVKTQKGFKISTIAGFWSAKEACSKALGVGICNELRFFDIQISKNFKNAPLLTLRKDKMQAFNISSIYTSISHDSGFAIAVVMIQTN